MGWQPTSGLTFIAGRQDNPFYTTSDFFWGVDFGLNGMVERLDLHKFINLTFGAVVPGANRMRVGQSNQWRPRQRRRMNCN
jgi:hypothetical protein